MSKLTTSQVADRLHISTRHVKTLLDQEILKGEKIDPTKKTSAYLIFEKSVETYEQARKSRGRAAKRCEPCNHQPKKLCASCERHICIKDYRFRAKTKLPSAHCKDCENERKQAARRN